MTAEGDNFHLYDAVSGVSGGGVNAAILASYILGREGQAVTRMLKYWRNAADQEMYHDWVGGVVEGATFKGGLYNPEPMTEFLASELADIEPMQRFVDIGITNFEKGTYQENFKDSLDQNLAEVLQASLTWAGFFPPYEFDD